MVKGSRVCHPKICLFGDIDYFRLVSFKKPAAKGEALNKEKLPFVKHIHICKGNLHLYGCFPPTQPAFAIGGEGKASVCITTLPLCTELSL